MTIQHFGDELGKVGEPRVRQNDGVAAPLVLLGDAQEATAVILADFEPEKLSLDLQFAALEDTVPGILTVGVRVGGLAAFF